MVFEQIFKPTWIERKEHAIFLGFIYSLIGLFSSALIFPASLGVMSVAFASILLIPSLNILLKLEENVVIREKKFSLKQLFKDHKDILKTYLFAFLGIFIAYFIASVMLPSSTITSIFSPQLKAAGIHGFAVNQNPITALIINNLIVLFVCFMLSVVYGAGSILFLSWNASVWGSVFGYFIREILIQGSFTDAILLFLPFLPHMITEALAYISAAVAGGVLSKAVIREKRFSKKFNHIITDSFIFVAIGILFILIAATLEVKFFTVI